MNQTDKKVLDYIIQFKLDNDGNSPSMREIADALEEVSSTSHVAFCLDNLEADGLIETAPKYSRFIKVCGGIWTFNPELQRWDLPES